MSGDHNHIFNTAHLTQCATCGYPLTEDERTGLVEINGKMHKPWVGLTDEEIKDIIGPWAKTPIRGYTRALFARIEAKLKEKNHE